MSDLYPKGAADWDDTPMVFKNNVLLIPEGADYTWSSGLGRIVLVVPLLPTDTLTVVYKHHEFQNDMINTLSEAKTPYVIGEWTFDLSDQDMGRQFRGVTVYGLTNRTDANDDDAFTQHETWATAGVNSLDSEVKYMLNAVFNPWDLANAVEKQEYTWLWKGTATSSPPLTAGLNDPLYYQTATSSAEVGANAGITAGGTAGSLGWQTNYGLRQSGTGAVAQWRNKFENTLPVTPVSKNWVAYINGGTNVADGYAMVKVTPPNFGLVAGANTFANLVDFDFWYSMITDVNHEPTFEVKLYANPTDALSWVNLVAQDNAANTPINTWTHYTLNNIQSFLSVPYTADTAFYIAGVGGNQGNDADGNPIVLGNPGTAHSWEYWTHLLGALYVAHAGVTQHSTDASYIDDISLGYLAKDSGIRYERVYNMEEDKLIPSAWNAYDSFSERVLAGTTLLTRGTGAGTYSIDFARGTISGTGITKVIYHTIEANDKGRYEWVTVGRDSSPVDSVGSALVAEVFNSVKDIAIGNAGQDMPYGLPQDASYQIPNVVTRATVGTITFPALGSSPIAKNDYKDEAKADNFVGYRVHLADDWCTRWPVAGSDMIGVGGPVANLLSYYGNDLTTALFGISTPAFAPAGSPYAGKITGIADWNRGWNGTWNTYIDGFIGSTAAPVGYAVISTTRDLNGTILFNVWGYSAQDTFYACQWLKGDEAAVSTPATGLFGAFGGRMPGIIELQSAPPGATSIILKIDYTYPMHPTFTIPEVLGTMTEARWVDAIAGHNDVTSIFKGEIHDP
jgi:hypothetical protein